jgi:hypothetical protein
MSNGLGLRESPFSSRGKKEQNYLAVDAEKAALNARPRLDGLVNRAWFLFNAFIGLNPLPSAFTGGCPVTRLFRKPSVSPAPGARQPG